MASPRTNKNKELTIGILTVEAVSVGAVATQIFDSSTSGRTPNQNARVVQIYNPDAGAAKIYIGDSGVSALLFSYELSAGDPPYIIDLNSDGMTTLWAVSAGGAVNVMVTQLG